MRKAVTLTELLIAVSLMMVVILGAASFDIASRNFLNSSERKTQVLNELTLILEYLDKAATTAHGSPDNPAFSASGNTLYIQQDVGTPPTPNDYSDDVAVQCDINIGSHTIDCGGARLSQRLMVFTYAAHNCALTVTNITLRYDPDSDPHDRDNPEVKAENINFLSHNCSLN
jgi:hypothetical protein